mmetsp:Transcript_30890/g.83697  ORF Transcript_30890/g.83697 Transcript_30890/m.83697 type:complete len:246 (-) Transcript_30890:891-1628(-)
MASRGHDRNTFHVQPVLDAGWPHLPGPDIWQRAADSPPPRPVLGSGHRHQAVHDAGLHVLGERRVGELARGLGVFAGLPGCLGRRGYAVERGQELGQRPERQPLLEPRPEAAEPPERRRGHVGRGHARLPALPHAVHHPPARRPASTRHADHGPDVLGGRGALPRLPEPPRGGGAGRRLRHRRPLPCEPERRQQHQAARGALLQLRDGPLRAAELPHRHPGGARRAAERRPGGKGSGSVAAQLPR